MRRRSLSAALLLSALTGLAHAEGNYNGMNMGFLGYAMVAAAVMGIQAIYTLSLTDASFGTRILWAFGLLVVNAMILGGILQSSGPAMTTMLPYIGSVIPGFIAIYFFTKFAGTPASTDDTAPGE